MQRMPPCWVVMAFWLAMYSLVIGLCLEINSVVPLVVLLVFSVFLNVVWRKKQ